MSDEDHLQKAVRRAEEAKRVVNEPLLVEAFGRIETEATKALADSHKMTDPQLRAVSTVLHVVGRVRSILAKVMADGEAARIEIRNLMVKDADKARRKAA